MGEAKAKAVAMASGKLASCGNCRYFRRGAPLQPMGVCRNRPPIPLVVGAVKHPTSGEMFPRTDTFWPQLPDTEWCGAWEFRTPALEDIDLSKLQREAMEGSA